MIATVRCNGGPVPIVPRALPIYDIQGRGLASEHEGRQVTTRGIVTAVATNGYYIQDAIGDGDDRTSDALFVYTNISPDVSRGELVEVTGTVTEWRTDSDSLSVTQLIKPKHKVISQDNDLPKPVRIGEGGRKLAQGPLVDAMAFYAQLESMRVDLVNSTVIGPTDSRRQIFVLPDAGRGAMGRTARGGVALGARGPSSQAIQLQIDKALSPTQVPLAQVGDRIPSITGVVTYREGRYEVRQTQSFVVEAAGLPPQRTTLTRTEEQLTVASFNVENLDVQVEDRDRVSGPSDIDDDVGSGKLAGLASQIALNLGGPDIVALQEVQDNNGAENDEVVDASRTYEALIAAIVAAGGPRYEWIDIPPQKNKDGGQPGGNIRVGYLFDPTRVTVNRKSAQRIGEDNEAFVRSRKSLAVEAEFNGHRLVLVNNHLSSKRGSSPAHGTIQPPTNGGVEKRTRQAEVVAEYLDQAEASGAAVVVFGDFNEVEYNEPLERMKGTSRVNLTETLAENERYSYIFQGDGNAIDHILISQKLADGAEFQAVHVNAELTDKKSDHDPVVARLTLPKRR